MPTMVEEVVAMVMAKERPLREGDRVELLPGAPVPARFYLHPGARGRVAIVDAPSEPSVWVTVVFSRSGRAVQLQRRWLRRVEQPAKRRSRKAREGGQGNDTVKEQA